jgi:[protein-PII] uridylyltransferase
LHEKVVGREVPVGDLLARRRLPVGRARSPQRKAPTVVVRNDVSDFYTVVDVTADDRQGLLYDLTSALSEHGLEIYVSKATTVLDQVADTFYVKDGSQKRLTDTEAVERLREALVETAGAPPDEPR